MLNPRAILWTSVLMVGCGGRSSGIPEGHASTTGGEAGSGGVAGALSGSTELVEAGSGSSVGTSGALVTDGAAEAMSGPGAEPLDTSDASTSAPPSCALGGPGLTDCGLDNDNCCASPLVTGGTFDRTDVVSDGGPTIEGDPATITDVRLDKYDVTVGRFRQFVKAWSAGWLPDPGSGKHSHLNGGKGLVNYGDYTGVSYETGWVASDDSSVTPTDANLTCTFPNAAPVRTTWTAAPGTHEDSPIVCSSWEEAYAFCIWDGGFLPSDAEWVYAAAGGAQQRPYPWGTTDPATGNLYYFGQDLGAVGTAPSGAGRWGQMDLLGDVSQWVLDVAGNTPYTEPCTDCAYLYSPPGACHLVEGGEYNPTTSPMRASICLPPRAPFVGFRCARVP